MQLRWHYATFLLYFLFKDLLTLFLFTKLIPTINPIIAIKKIKTYTNTFISEVSTTGSYIHLFITVYPSTVFS